MVDTGTIDLCRGRQDAIAEASFQRDPADLDAM